jgi:hypothetical protein
VPHVVERNALNTGEGWHALSILGTQSAGLRGRQPGSGRAHHNTHHMALTRRTVPAGTA